MKTIKFDLKRNKKKIFISLTAILLVTLFILTVCVFAPLIRRPKYVEGNIFDKKVQKVLLNDWFEKPDGVLNQSHSSMYYEDGKQSSYVYVFYTQNPLGENYVNEVKQSLLQKQGTDLIIGEVKSVTLYTLFEMGVGKTTTDENCVEYTAYYTNLLQRRFLKGFFLPELTLCAMYIRRFSVTSYLTANSDGLYKTVVVFSANTNKKEKFTYSKEDKKEIRKFIKLV